MVECHETFTAHRDLDPLVSIPALSPLILTSGLAPGSGLIVCLYGFLPGHEINAIAHGGSRDRVTGGQMEDFGFAISHVLVVLIRFSPSPRPACIFIYVVVVLLVELVFW